MIPAEIAVLLLFLFIVYQSIMGFLKQRTFEEELAKVWERVRTLDSELDDVNKRVERIETKRLERIEAKNEAS